MSINVSLIVLIGHWGSPLAMKFASRQTTWCKYLTFLLKDGESCSILYRVKKFMTKSKHHSLNKFELTKNYINDCKTEMSRKENK